VSGIIKHEWKEPAMAAKKKPKKKTKASARRKAAPKKKVLKSKTRVERKSRKKAVQKPPAAAPIQPLQPIVEEKPIDIEERQEEIHDAEDAIVDEQEDEELGEAV
jgi:hypothetical protein